MIISSITIHLYRSMNMHKQNIQTLQYWQLFFDSIIFLSNVTDDEGCYFRTWHVNWSAQKKSWWNQRTVKQNSILTGKICLFLCFSCSFSVNRRDEPYEIEKGLICTVYHMKRAIKRQPIRDTVDAERTTTITLPARLTRAPRPAPTMTWASCTMQVRAAQSMPVPRLCRAGSSRPNFLRSCDKRGVLHKKKSYNLI